LQVTTKLSTTISNIQTVDSNEESRQLILQFLDFIRKIGPSERYQNNNLKAIIDYSKFVGPSVSLNQVKNRILVTSFLDSKIKGIEEDPDKRWITTWNDNLVCIKHFFNGYIITPLTTPHIILLHRLIDTSGFVKINKK
jgi:hypothetical protein